MRRNTAGTAVVMDRYWLSSVAYGAARNADVDVSSLAARVPAPDLTVLLTLEESERRRRLQIRGGADEDAETLKPGFSETVLRVMRSEAQPAPLRPKLEIDVSSLSVEEVVDRIVRELDRLARARAGGGLVPIERRPRPLE